MAYTYDYPMPAVTTDCAILNKKSRTITEILLIKRLKEPFKNYWALPGGYVEIDEELDDAAKRELFEETGIKHDELKQLLTVGTLGRDPRYRTISIVYFGYYDAETMIIKAGDDAVDAKWFPINCLPELAFDHEKIIKNVLSCLKYSKSD